MALVLGPGGQTRTNEWPSALDVAALIAEGWRPTPFREFVLKIHSRCDLACDYCYVYEMADQSWRSRPIRMSYETATAAARRIAEHVGAHGLPSVRLTLHGGEPLLAGPELIAHVVTAVRSAVRDTAGPEVRVDACVQTNAVGLSLDYLRLFDELDVGIGVSLDGDAHAHDRHRRRANGLGSHAAVAAALELLARDPFRRLFNGILCTIDVRNDPVTTYEALLEFEPPAIDLLLPHGNWTAPPPGRVPGAAATPYGDWLIAIFDRWYGSPRQETRVRLFTEIMRLLLGGTSMNEAVGLSPVGVAVVETDGGVEGSDALKSAYEGAPATGLNVVRDPFDAALRLPSTAARQIGPLALSDECRACRLRRVCGAGLYAHRYRAGHGFANPSVYCPDLFRLITHIRRTVESDVAALRERRR